MIEQAVGFGKSESTGRYQQFDLTPAEMGDLSQRIAAAASAGRDITVPIGEAVVTFTYGSETGNATRPSDKHLVFQSNRSDLSSLADALRELSEATETYVHLHLEPGFLVPSPSVSDIVFQLSC